MEQAVRYFEQAIAEDPGFALAYTGLADAYAQHVDYRNMPVAEGLERRWCYFVEQPVPASLIERADSAFIG